MRSHIARATALLMHAVEAAPEAGRAADAPRARAAPAARPVRARRKSSSAKARHASRP